MSAVNVNTKQFQELLQGEKPVLVDYWAPWCGYCRRIGPAYEKIAQQYEGRCHAVKVNIDEEGLLAADQEIDVIPTLVLYREGKAAASIVAPESKAAIDAFLQENLAK